MEIPLRRAVVSAALTLVGVVNGAAAWSGEEPLLLRVKQLVVRVETRIPGATDDQAAVATGFGLIVAQGDLSYVVTARHILALEGSSLASPPASSSMNRLSVIPCEGPMGGHDGVIVKERADWDLAVLRVARPLSPGRSRRVLDRRPAENGRGVGLVRLGPEGQCEVSPRTGVVSSPEVAGRFGMDGLPAEVGFSGTALFTAGGVLGMLTSTAGTGRRSEAISIEAIRDWMRQERLPFDLLPLEGPKRLSFAAGVSYGRIGLGFELPRDLTIHANHPDDRFLTGDPGTTDLKRAWVDAAEVEVGALYRLGDGNAALRVAYAARLPLASSGRSERQQANDPRPPANGSYIYTALTDVDVSHALRGGLEWTRSVSSDRRWWIEIEGLVEINRWSVTLAKGWSRFGLDQAEAVSKATGFSFGPTLRFSVGAGPVSLQLSASLSSLTIEFEDPRMASSTGSGIAFNVGFGFRPGRRLSDE